MGGGRAQGSGLPLPLVRPRSTLVPLTAAVHRSSSPSSAWASPSSSPYSARAPPSAFVHWSKMRQERMAAMKPPRSKRRMGMQQHVMSFEVGGVLEDSKWQAPVYCFNGDNANTANVAADGVHSDVGMVDVMNNMIRSAGAPASAVPASFDQ